MHQSGWQRGGSQLDGMVPTTAFLNKSPSSGRKALWAQNKWCLHVIKPSDIENGVPKLETDLHTVKTTEGGGMLLVKRPRKTQWKNGCEGRGVGCAFRQRRGRGRHPGRGSAASTRPCPGHRQGSSCPPFPNPTEATENSGPSGNGGGVVDIVGRMENNCWGTARCHTTMVSVVMGGGHGGRQGRGVDKTGGNYDAGDMGGLNHYPHIIVSSTTRSTLAPEGKQARRERGDTKPSPDLAKKPPHPPPHIHLYC